MLTGPPAEGAWRCQLVILNQNWKRSLIAGFVLSLTLHISSATITALFPYHDEPMTPPLVFIYLLWPGWQITGGPWPFHLWRETVAVAINGALYSVVVYFLLPIWNTARDKCKSDT
jgi:hypothetical protein